ncbi:MAG: hypothetical protein IJ837_00255 [Clostridia bacterium]|nr:hypothetical protein [Clostridia bacterium]
MELKEYAKRAKERLTNGYWDKVREEKIEYLEKYYHKGDNINQFNYMFQKKIEDEVYSEQKSKNEDKLYKKVVKLLSENEFVLNPIMQLIDHDEYDKLSDEAKKNYIYALTDRYNELKEKYEKEQKTKEMFN